MSRASRVGHLLGSRELAGMPTEVIHRGARVATHALVIMSGLAFADVELKVDREPVRAMAAEGVKCKRSDAPSRTCQGDGGPAGRPFTAVTECDWGWCCPFPVAHGRGK